MTDGAGKIVRAPPYGIEPLQWSQLEGFFKEHGCVAVGDRELRWYRESWGALEKAGLAGAAELAEFGLDRTVLKLRALCLLAMYLGIYQVAGEHTELGGYFSGHAPCSWYLDSLHVDSEDIWELARQAGILETDAENYWEDEDVDDELLYELATELVENETHAIFEALVDRYGGRTELFAALWNSRKPSDESEPSEGILDSVNPGDGKREVRSYVENGMTEWRLT